MKIKVSALSAYGRPQDHLTQQTVHGAIVTIIGVLLASVLFAHEVGHFWKLSRSTKVGVDLTRRHDLHMNLDISFLAIPCAVLKIDVADAAGTSMGDMMSSGHGGAQLQLHKVRLDAQGRRVGRTEYHTPQSQRVIDNGPAGMVTVNLGTAMQHITEMEEESGHHEGCRVYGRMTVRRVAGQMRFSVHTEGFLTLMPQLLGGHHPPRMYNVSHVVHRLAFGPTFFGQVNPLDGFVRVMHDQLRTFKYFIKLVPTEHYSRLGRATETHQYSVNEHSLPIKLDELMPDPYAQRPSASVELLYDLSPVVLTINERPPSVLHFVVRVCAVVGGAFSITRMLDRWVAGVAGLLGTQHVQSRQSGAGASSAAAFLPRHGQR